MKKYFFAGLLIVQGLSSYAQTKKPAPVNKKPVIKSKPAVVANTKTPVKTSPVKKTVAIKPALKKPVVVKPTVKTVTTPVKTTTETATPPPLAVTSREQEMINEINQLRANPAKYCTYVEDFLQRNETDNDVKSAAKELVSQLKTMKPLDPLAVNLAMYRDAKQYGQVMAKKNVFEHSDLPYYENLSLGYRSVRDAIVDLLIDDGNPGRGHRRNLLNQGIKQVAVYEVPGKVQDIGWCYIQVFK